MGLDITGIGAVSDAVTTIVNKIWPDKSEQEKQEIAGAFSLLQGQLAINQVEAANPSIFVSGWRPACGWCCLGVIVYHAAFMPFLGFLCNAVGHPVALPTVDPTLLSTVTEVLFALIGARSFEKYQGVARK